MQNESRPRLAAPFPIWTRNHPEQIQFANNSSGFYDSRTTRTNVNVQIVSVQDEAGVWSSVPVQGFYFRVSGIGHLELVLFIPSLGVSDVETQLCIMAQKVGSGGWGALKIR